MCWSTNANRQSLFRPRCVDRSMTGSESNLRHDAISWSNATRLGGVRRPRQRKRPIRFGDDTWKTLIFGKSVKPKKREQKKPDPSWQPSSAQFAPPLEGVVVKVEDLADEDRGFIMSEEQSVMGCIPHEDGKEVDCDGTDSDYGSSHAASELLTAAAGECGERVASNVDFEAGETASLVVAGTDEEGNDFDAHGSHFGTNHAVRELRVSLDRCENAAPLNRANSSPREDNRLQNSVDDNHTPNSNTEAYTVNSSPYDVRAYKCRFCSLKFTQVTDLRRHERSHSDRGLFRCGICRRRLATRLKWELHMRFAPSMGTCKAAPNSLGNGVMATGSNGHGESSDVHAIRCFGADAIAIGGMNNRNEVAVYDSQPVTHGKNKLGSYNFDCSSSNNNVICWNSTTSPPSRSDGLRSSDVTAAHSSAELRKCRFCTLRFADASGLRQHETWHSERGCFRCQTCRLNLTTRRKWELHTQLKSCASTTDREGVSDSRQRSLRGNKAPRDAHAHELNHSRDLERKAPNDQGRKLVLRLQRVDAATRRPIDWIRPSVIMRKIDTTNSHHFCRDLHR